MTDTAMIIGPRDCCGQLERQLDLLNPRPVSIGWVVTDAPSSETDDPILGTVDDLESVIARRRPTLAVVTAPGVMNDWIAGVRTRLRKLGVTDRYVGHLLPLAFLAPDIVASVLSGTQPVDLTAEALTKRISLPLAWADQRKRLGFD